MRADPADSSSSPRVASIDLVRGAVMVLMAIDHVRVYSGVPAGGPDPAVFFTRWITNFCAPAFVFLAGTSAFLHGQRLFGRRALARFLVTRGLLLVVLELTVLRAAWTFNLDTGHLLAGVIWMLGWCMVLLAALVFLPTGVIGGLGLAIVLLHNLVDAHRPAILPTLETRPDAWLLQVLYFGGPVRVADGVQLAVLYSIVPRIGVMAAGYAFGEVLRLPPARRDRWCLGIGLGATAAFLVLRGFNLYGNPSPWGGPSSRLPAALAFLATTKYPASLHFLLMTLGPTIALLPALEHASGRLVRALTVFGRVPLFFYLLHVPLIHLVALAVSVVRSGTVDPWLFSNHPMMVPPAPQGYAWGLGLLYAVWLGVVLALYVPCRWFAAVKRGRAHTSEPGRRDPGGSWLSYL